MTAHEFDRDFAITARDERAITRKVVEKIAFCEHKMFYAELGYTSVVDWLVRGHHYSKTSALRRSHAARLVTIVPEANDMMVEGKVNVSTLSALQSAIRQEEVRTKQKISPTRKEDLVQKIAEKTFEQTARVIATEFPELRLEKTEWLKPVGASETKLTMIFSEEDMAVLQRMKEVTSHSNFNASWSELVIVAAKEFLKRHDPMLKKPKPKKSNSKESNSKESNSKESQSQTSKPISATRLSQPRTAARKTLSGTENPRAEQIGSTKMSTINSPMNQSRSESDRFGSPCSKNTSPLAHATEMRIRRRDHDQCTYVDPRTGTKCGSRMQIEVDHIIPRALGGSNEPENLRCLCRTHNIMMANRRFGASFMRQKATLRLN